MNDQLPISCDPLYRQMVRAALRGDRAALAACSDYRAERGLRPLCKNLSPQTQLADYHPLRRKLRARSPYTRRAVEYVARHPGCCKWDLASALTWNDRRCPSKQYYLVNTQIRIGAIEAMPAGNRYELYVALPETLDD